MAEETKKDNDVRERVLHEGKDVLRDLSGVSDWERSKVGTILGISPIVSAVRNSFGGAVTNLAVGTFKVLKPTFGRERVEPLPSDEKDPRKRFERAQELYQKSDMDVDEMTKQSSTQALLFFVGTLLALLWGFISFHETSASLPAPLGYIFPFFLVFPLSCLFLRTSFYNWQLRHRRLGSFMEFLRSGEVLAFGSSREVPKTSSRDYRNRVGSFLFFLLGVTLFMPVVAFAQEQGSEAATGMFTWTSTLPDGDLFHQILRMIVPNIGPVGDPIPGMNTALIVPLGAAFGAFNATLLLVGSAMLGWFTLAGTVASAHEGKVLGSRWHYIWAPIRVTTGIGFLAPVAGGYCAAQLLVLQLIVWGGGIGNAVWSTYVYSLTGGQDRGAVITPLLQQGVTGTHSEGSFASTTQSLSFTRDLANKLICYVGISDFEETNGPQNTRIGGSLIPQWPIKASVDAYSMQDEASASGTGEFRYGLEDPLPDSGFSNIKAILNHIEKLKEDRDKAISHGSGQSSIDAYNKSIADLEGYLDSLRVEPTGGGSGGGAGSGTPVPPGGPWVWDFGRICGKMELNPADHESFFGYVKSQNVNSDDVAGEVAEEYRKLASAIQNDIMIDMFEFATTYVAWFKSGNTSTPPPFAKLTSARNKYSLATAKMADGILNIVRDKVGKLSGDYLAEEAAKRGWASSGVFYMTLSRLQEGIFRLTDVNVSHTPLRIQDLDQEGELRKFLLGAAKEGDTRHRGLLIAFADHYDADLETAPIDKRALKAGQHMNSEDHGNINEILDEVFGGFMEGALSWFVDLGTANPNSALGDMVGFGHTLLIIFSGAVTAFLALFAGVTYGTGFLNAFSWVPIVGSVAKGASNSAEALIGQVATFIKFLLGIILVVGAIHAYVLPMIPYIMMLFFIMGMVALTVEALVAAPIWAFFHIRLDGHDFIDQVQRPGYMIAFNLMLRPALAVLGLILSFSVFGAMVWFLKQTFYPAAISATAGFGFGIIGIMTMLLVLCYLHWQLAIRSFSLITSVPDRVTRWFGYGGEHLGEEGESQRSTQFLVGNIAARGERSLMAAGLMQGRGQPRGNGEQANTPSGNQPQAGANNTQQPTRRTE